MIVAMRAWFVVVAVVVGAAPASAQPTAAELFVEGRKLLDTDPAGACRKFEAALRVQPGAPSLLLNMGLCNEKQGRLATALDYYQRTLNKVVEQPSDENREFEAAAKDRIAALGSKVARVTIELPATQPDVAVQLDGRPLDRRSLADTKVDAGHRTLRASAQGKQPHTVELDIQDGDRKTVVIPELVAVDAPRPLPPPPPPARGHRGLGIGLAIGGAALVGGSVALAKWAQVHYEDQGADQADKGERVQRFVATPMFGLGVIGAAIGGYFILTAPRAERRTTATAVVPVVSPEGVGAAISGRF